MRHTVILADQLLHDLRGQVMLRVQHPQLLLPIDRVHTVDPFQQRLQLLVSGLGPQLQCAAMRALHLLAELVDPAAGDQPALHEDADPVADLLDLV